MPMNDLEDVKASGLSSMSKTASLSFVTRDSDRKVVGGERLPVSYPSEASCVEVRRLTTQLGGEGHHCPSLLSRSRINGGCA